jgi:hypothetical protein
MTTKEIQQLFKPCLFWDTNIADIDINKHNKFIIERVIKRGTRKDWETTLKLYGKKSVRDQALTIRSLDPKSLNYLSIFFNTNKNKFRCSK